MAQKIDFQLAPVSSIEAEIGKRLASLRLNANLSQARLAEEAGVARRTITRLEHGEGISLDTLVRIMRALGIADRLETLLPDPAVQPIDRVRLKGKQRQRARARRGPVETDWTWADTDGDDSAS
jgi:transcriptional regulator with XRE-family HTH domain